MKKMNIQSNFGKKNKSSKDLAFVALLLLDAVLFVLLISSFGSFAIAVVGGNVTVSTLLTVGAVSPEILSVVINGDAATLDLSANTTVPVFVQVIARDWNGEGDINLTYSEFFDLATSSYGGANDNNFHYTNSSCSINYTYGTAYEVNSTCRFDVFYYANNATWNATVRVTDNTSRNATGSDTIVINSLLAVGLPNTIDYGIVNETLVSDEKAVNVTNFGNVMLNLSLEGYARSQGDNYSFNCSLGSLQNISVGYQKFNLTASNTSLLNLAQFTSLYTNLSGNRTIWRFDVAQRRNDTVPYYDETNATYWRAYVPIGVAGSCTGNIIFGAATQTGQT